MTRRRIIFLAVFGVYQLLALIFTIYLEVQRDDIGTLTFIHGRINLLKYASMFGVVLIVVEVAWSWWVDRTARKEEAYLRAEMEKLKARLSDLQHNDPKVAPSK